ncbi:MAG: glucose-1-phosphate adenylyltransferase [Chthoniobacteraceae bacterium]|nr:glucose-1-phosphate adenylyltransferase [Chthoniobacteraceae bacterium]
MNSAKSAHFSSFSSVTHSTLAIIMGGGAGTRLFPLTKDRSKPAVPLGGKYRIVDIPISNCINSDLRHIYVLTQFNSASLHRHIASAYKFDRFSRSFVEILAAQQTPSGSHWYQGTADAVRQNLQNFVNRPYQYYVILSGDQLYKMDFRDLLRQHIEEQADISIATIPVDRASASDFGIMHTDASRQITQFVEKPKEPELLDSLKIPAPLLQQLGHGPEEELYQASMGIYVFNRQALIEALDNDLVDFGKHIIPRSIEKYKVHSYIFQGYWEDIGTIRSFFNANLALTDEKPPFSFFDTSRPVYTHARFLPASKIQGASVQRAVVSDGCVIANAQIEHAVIGVRSFINSGTTIRHAILMGNDFFDTDIAQHEAPCATSLGIGRNCVIDHAIIDKNARIGDNVVITPEGKPEKFDGPNYYIRDGIVIVPKNTTIPAGTVI